MMGRIQIKERGATPRNMRAAYTKGSKTAWTETGKFWHRSHMPRHFAESAFARYKYQPRSKAYQKKKRSLKKHGRPLVWSGDTEQAVKRYRDVRATSKGARLVMNVPALNFFRVLGTDAGGRTYTTPKMRLELTASTAAERKAAAEKYDTDLDRLLRSYDSEAAKTRTL